MRNQTFKFVEEVLDHDNARLLLWDWSSGQEALAVRGKFKDGREVGTWPSSGDIG